MTVSSPAQQQLTKLLERLEELLKTGSSNAEQVAFIKAQISDLQKLVGDEGSAENQYAKDYAGIIQELQVKTDALNPLAVKIDAGLSGTEKQRVERIIKEADAGITKLQAAATAATGAADAKAGELAKKKEQTKLSQDKLADLKNLLKPFAGNLKEAGDAITKTGASVSAGSLAPGLFWAGEATAAIGKVTPPQAHGVQYQTGGGGSGSGRRAQTRTHRQGRVGQVEQGEGRS